MRQLPRGTQKVTPGGGTVSVCFRNMILLTVLMLMSAGGARSVDDWRTSDDRKTLRERDPISLRDGEVDPISLRGGETLSPMMHQVDGASFTGQEREQQRELWDLSSLQREDLTSLQQEEQSDSWSLASLKQDDQYRFWDPILWQKQRRQLPWDQQLKSVALDSISSHEQDQWELNLRDLSLQKVAPSLTTTLEDPSNAPSGPYFLEPPAVQVSVRAGQPATLTCIVKHLGNRQVSWIRGRDLHVLSSGEVTFSSDSRVQVSHLGDSWTLIIKYTQMRDAGPYSCQVNTQPRLASWYNLTVIEARATIQGKHTLYVQAGSTVTLVCVVREQLLIPGLVLWYQDDRLVQRDAGRVTVVTQVDNVTSSTLTVTRASRHDSGNYSCWPSAGTPDSAIIHVIEGDPPAAMQHGNTAVHPSVTPVMLLLLLVLLLLVHPFYSSTLIIYT
nr:protein borderless-like [Cherax quadricarinatus]